VLSNHRRRFVLPLNWPADDPSIDRDQFRRNDLVTDDIHVLRCVDAEADVVRTDADDGDRDVIADMNLLFGLA
jgi:hypothetical protein